MEEFILNKAVSDLDLSFMDSRDIFSKTIENMYKDLNNQKDKAYVEGLKRKGYEFDNRNELIEFITSNCRCKDNVYFKERVYFVKDEPFLIHYYDTKTTQNFNIDEPYTISLDLGSYRFI